MKARQKGAKKEAFDEGNYLKWWWSSDCGKTC